MAAKVQVAVRPEAVAFDVNETLFSLSPLRRRLVEDGLGEQALGWWFDRVLRDGFALTVLGDYHPFNEVAVASLEGLAARLDVQRPGGWAASVVAEMRSLPAHEDAEPALRQLADAGVPSFALTNGSSEVTGALLSRTGLDRYVEEVVSIDDVRCWKPHTAPYLRGAEVAGVPPERLALVAVHGWDCHGAICAGLVAGWANRLERVLAPWVSAPHVTGESLSEVVSDLLALPEG